MKQQAQAFTSGQSRSRPDSGTVEGCARQPRCTKNPRGFCEHSCAAMLERLYLDFADDDDGHTGDDDPEDNDDDVDGDEDNVDNELPSGKNPHRS